MQFGTRYQGAVIQNGKILLIKQHFASGYECWNVPGGSREKNESEEQCVKREIKEETNLDVVIECLLIEGLSHRHSPYKRFKTYLCTPVTGQARPDGLESVEVAWFDLQDAANTSLAILPNETAYVMVQRIRSALGIGIYN
jgi:ADP-ribose pyrophosphatase YjhB (NUDIX family)